MRKRAGTPRHHQPRLDSLEERTLLSAIVVFSGDRPPRDAVVEKLQSIAPERWDGSAFGAVVQRSSPALAGYGSYMQLDDLDKGEAGNKFNLEKYASALPASLSGSTSLWSGEQGTSLWGVGGKDTSVFFFNSASPRAATSVLRVAMTGSSASETGESMASVGPLPAFVSAFVIGRAGQDGVYLPVLRTIPGFPFNPGLRANLGLLPDDRYGPPRVMHEGHDVFLPMGHVPGAVDGATLPQPQVGPTSESREIQAPSANSGPAAGSVPVPARVGAAVRETAPSFDLESALGRSLMPISEVSISAVETVSAMAVDVVVASEGALGSVIAGGNVSEPPGREVVPQAEGETPVPQGLGLIADLLPFDSHTVAEAIDRFFDRFEDLDSSAGADADDDREPAALYPPPGALLLAVATAEVARRHFRRRREADAAARPRRRVVEGLGFEESFGSSGPWSSRLS